MLEKTLHCDSLGNRRKLLGLRHVILGESVHLNHCFVHLLDALRLLLSGGADLGDQIGDFFHASDDFS